MISAPFSLAPPRHPNSENASRKRLLFFLDVRGVFWDAGSITAGVVCVKRSFWKDRVDGGDAHKAECANAAAGRIFCGGACDLGTPAEQ